MPGHLILVVHGIGEQKPGETVDSVLAGAIAEQERFAHVQVPSPAPSAVDVQADVVEIPQQPFGPDAPREMPHFPLHLRTVQRAGHADAPTILADVYWADISLAPTTKFWTLLDLIRTVLGTSYLAMENAKSMGSRSSFWLVLTFAWAFFAGIAAINTLLFIGVLILWPLQLVGWIGPEGTLGPLARFAPEHLTALNGLLTVLLGLVIELRKDKTHLQAQFARGLMGAGLIAIAYVLGTVLEGQAITLLAGLGAYAALGGVMILRNGVRRLWIGWLLSAVAGVLLVYSGVAAIQAVVPDPPPSDVDLVAVAPPAAVEYFADYIGVAIRIMGAVWFLSLLLCLFIYLSSWAERARDQRARHDRSAERFEKHRRIYPAICSALVLFWMVLASSFWVFVEYAVRTTSLSENAEETLLETLFNAELSEALGGMTIAVFWFFALLAVAGLVGWRRLQLRNVLHHAGYAEQRRLLLNIWFQRVFVLSSLAIGFVVTHLLVTGLTIEIWQIPNGQYWPVAVSQAGQSLVAWLGDWEDPASVFLLLLAFAVYNLFEPVAKALGVIRDITVYATTRRREFWNKDRQNNYHNREAIDARFERVLELTVKAALPDRLTVISHSLGTVVATRVLGRVACADASDGLPPDTTLVTMGSPVTHIYRKYFPGNFEVSEELLNGRIRWLNIYRRDDFVGTRITGFGDRVRNFDVPAAGHPGYFVDRDVWKILGEQADIRLS